MKPDGTMFPLGADWLNTDWQNRGSDPCMLINNFGFANRFHVGQFLKGIPGYPKD